MPLTRYRIPKNARRAAFGHMNDYNLETRSWLGPIKFAQREEKLKAIRRRQAEMATLESDYNSLRQLSLRQPRDLAERHRIPHIAARPRLLSVIESVALPSF